ncbi:MAG TPA: type II toxin-antitoxin system RelE/ParE family toxin [Gallionella sp.]|nr:type II toxin-antitoxin system RelE/ParE family toxin [Gallionella sp.]
MPRVKLSPRAQSDIKRLYDFLAAKDTAVAGSAVDAIVSSFVPLTRIPKIGRKKDGTDLRELVIDFGSSGYIALYDFDEEVDEVVITALRHQKENDYAA